MIIHPFDKRDLFAKLKKGIIKKGLSTGFSGLDDKILLSKSRMAIVTGYPSSGKALDIYTHIPTSTGFKFMYEIKVGDKVFNEEGQLCNVTACTGIQYFRPCYEIEFSSGEKIVCDEDHRWFTDTVASRMSAKNANKRAGQPLKPKGTDQSHKRILPTVKTTKEIFNTLLAKDRKNNHSIENCKPCNGIKKDLIIEPYTLGAWLGDGRTDYASIYCEEPEMLSRIQSEGYITREQAVPHHHGIIKGFVGKLRELGVLHNKHIPNDYLFASYEQKLALLQGLMDSDGYCAKSGNCEYCTTRKELGEQVLDLINSMGFKAVMNEGRATLYGKDCGPKYRIIFTPNGTEVFSLKRKQERVKTNSYTGHRTIKNCKPVPSRAVKCIQVDSSSHLYLCTRSYIPTHNSEFVDAINLNMSILYNWKHAIYSPESHPIEEHMASIAEKYIGKRITEFTNDEIEKSLNFLNEHYTWLHPAKPNIDSLLVTCQTLQNEQTLDSFTFDPWNAITNTRGGEMVDEYLAESLTKVLNTTRDSTLLGIIVAHPKNPIKDKDGNFPTPTLYDISGGANWRNRADYGIVCHRPDMGKNEMHVHIQKIKKKHLGKVGTEIFDYEWTSGRFKCQSSIDFTLAGEADSPF